MGGELLEEEESDEELSLLLGESELGRDGGVRGFPRRFSSRTEDAL